MDSGIVSGGREKEFKVPTAARVRLFVCARRGHLPRGTREAANSNIPLL